MWPGLKMLWSKIDLENHFCWWSLAIGVFGKYLLLTADATTQALETFFNDFKLLLVSTSIHRLPTAFFALKWRDFLTQFNRDLEKFSIIRKISKHPYMIGACFHSQSNGNYSSTFALQCQEFFNILQLKVCYFYVVPIKVTFTSKRDYIDCFFELQGKSINGF